VDDRIVSALREMGGAYEFVKTAVSGTTIFPHSGRDWSVSSTGDLFDRMVAATMHAMANVTAQGGIPDVVLVWSQGEADIHAGEARYSAALSALVTTFRERIGLPDARIAIVQMPDENGVRAAQLDVAATIPGIVLIETRGLERSDGLHFSDASSAAIGDTLFATIALTSSEIASYRNLGEVTTISRDEATAEVRLAPYQDSEFSWVDGKETANTRYVVQGGWGGDRIFTGRGDDVIHGGPGGDQVATRSGNDTIHGGDGSDHLYGMQGNDRIFGENDVDTISGGDGDDLLDGGDLLDYLYGDAGDDTIIGGVGPDILTGGTGADTFIYNAPRDSYAYPVPSAFFGIDTITDFNPGEDRIDLTALGELVFVGTAGFAGTRGEVRFVHASGDTLLSADLDADGKEDFAIRLTGEHDLTARDVHTTVIVPIVIMLGPSAGAMTLRDRQMLAELEGRGNAFEFLKAAFPEPGDEESVVQAARPGNALVELLVSAREAIANALAQGATPKLMLVVSEASGNDPTASQSVAALEDLLREFGEGAGAPVPEVQVITGFASEALGAGQRAMGVPRSIDRPTTEIVDALAPPPPNIPGYDGLWDRTAISGAANGVLEVHLARYASSTFRWVDDVDPVSGSYVVTGGLDDDRIFTGPQDDTVYGGGGSDQISTRDGNDVVHGGDGNDYISGLRGNDSIYGDGGNDVLWGGLGNDSVDGGEGNDIVLGEGGDDDLTGGGGRDLLTGGAGLDRFIYLRIDDSPAPAPNNPQGWDTITDFVPGEDVIDLTALGLLTFAGMGGFSGTAAEVRYAIEGADTFVRVDADADGLADLQIRLSGQYGLNANDFALISPVAAPRVPIVILAGQANVEYSAVAERLIAELSVGGGAFEFVKLGDMNATLLASAGLDWNARSDGELFDALTDATQAAIANVVAGGNVPVIRLLYVGGEIDSGASTERYETELREFIAAFRQRIGNVEAEFGISLVAQDNGVRAAQARVIEDIDGVFGIRTDDLAMQNGLVLAPAAAATLASRFIDEAGIHIASLPDYAPLWQRQVTTTLGERLVVEAPLYSDARFDGAASGAVTFRSGWGTDIVRSGAGNDDIRTGGGRDVIHSGAGNDTIDSGAGYDFVSAGTGDDIARTGDGVDYAYGGAGNDLLDLGPWRDYGYGESGDDTIIGGSGGDFLWGGSGADTFVYLSASDSFAYHLPSATFGFDTIGDFSLGEDILDFTALGTLGYKGEQPFTGGGSAEIRWAFDGENTNVYADIDGDGIADMLVRLTGNIALSVADFAL